MSGSKGCSDIFFTFGRTQHAPKEEGCAHVPWKGDKSCDDENNNEGCDFDGGDCCGSNVDKTYCTECECKSINGRFLSKEIFIDEVCEDKNNHCSFLAGGGYCDSAPIFTSANCAKSCGHCGPVCSTEFTDVICCIQGWCPENMTCDGRNFCKCKPGFISLFGGLCVRGE